ncbi:uncharacterized protein LOC130539351 [Takifugu flavidus]|uniref:uncharacterized protein LOC130539351 n=1 Tax=Takifugu flavidus TaxID=433684 RepID=UPI0025440F3C|nr:uncharacterized protein LOC130539351 [Takifugu flavidus]
MTVQGRGHSFLVDSGARYSTISWNLTPELISSDTVELVGFSGRPERLPFSVPLVTRFAGQTVLHPFVISPHCPINLLGRDLLVRTGAAILCGDKGLVVQFPNGMKLNCCIPHQGVKGQMLMSVTPFPEQGVWADIYWGELEPETSPGVGVVALFQSWRPWLSMLSPFAPPVDPYHVTLFYDRENNEVYQDAFREKLQGNFWMITSPCLFVGPEGVAAQVDLTAEQNEWYEMGEEACPHVTLAIHAEHQAKDLGPMIKRLMSVTDWSSTQIPGLLYSPSEKSYKIMHTTTNSVILQHRQIQRFHGREKTDHPDSAQILNALPETLWSSGPTDVGLCSTVEPVTFSVSDYNPVWQSQYKHRPPAEEGIQETIEGLLISGVLEYSTSAWNTPILPVEKQEKGKYRMAHDLRRINSIVTTPTVPVPNPYTAISALSPSHKWFTCIDLANAFFCLPLHSAMRDIFSFTYKGRQLRYTRLPQGFILSPGIFNQTLRKLLKDLTLPEGVVLIQYVDDILLAATSAESCLWATQALLMHLWEKGFKVSRKKLQCCRRSVTFLGRVVSAQGTGVSPAHKSSILEHPKPETVKEMLSFLGLAGYSRHFIPAYSEKTTPLRAMVNEQGMRNLTARLTWTTEGEKAFIALKQALTTAAHLAVPDYKEPFFLDVSEGEHTVNGVLFQKKGGERKVLMYASIMLDPIENRQPSCVRHVAGLAKLLQKTAHLVMGHTLTVLTTHSVVSLVRSAAFTMTSLRQTRMDKILTAPHITYTHEGINMADGMGEGEPHRCEEKVKKDEKIRVDLKTEPLKDPDEILFTDGCCFRHPQEGLKAAYAIVRQSEEGFEEVETGKIKGKESARLAELRAVIRALEISKGKRVTINTDSAYVVGAIHLELCQWLRAGFNTASGSPIKHEAEMRQLTQALMEPAEVAVVKCKGHSKENSLEGRGNEAADQAAKKAAGYKPSYNLLLAEKTVHEILPRYDRERLSCDQEEASPQEKEKVWKERGAVKVEGIWRGPDGRPVLPPGLVDAVLEEAHGLTHCGKPRMMQRMFNMHTL